MTGNNLELALVLKVAQTGLENLTELIGQLKQAGYETGTFEDHADQLNAALKQFESDSGLADELRDIAGAADRADAELEALASEARTGANSQHKLADSLDEATDAMKKADDGMNRNIRSHKKVSDGVQSISSQLDRLQKLAGVAFLTNLVGDNLQDLARLTDGYTNLNSRLELAVGHGKAFDLALQGIRTTANDTGNSLESVGDLYTKLSRATNASAEEVAALTKTISQSFVVSGASATEADAAITQLSQGLASGVLRGDEFNSVMEQSPRLAQALADSLGVTRGELRAMAEDGQLTTETIVAALQQQAAAIDAEFQQMPDTIGRATQRLANEWQVFLGELNATSGASELAVSALNGVAENLDSIAGLIGTVAQVGAAALVVKLTPAVVAASREMIAAAASGKLFAGSLTQVGGAASAAGQMAGVLKGVLATAITTFVIEQALNLASAYKQLHDATQALNETELELANSNAQLADAYQAIADKTGVAVTNMAELEAALASGRLVIDEQTGAYLNAAQAAELKAQRDREAADAATQMAYSQTELSARLAEVNEQLQVAIDDNSKLAGVMSGSLLDALKHGETGIAAFAIGLRGAQQQGQLTQQQIDTGLGAALEKLSSEERTRFGDAIKVAMEKIEAGAEGAGVTVNQLQFFLDALDASEAEAAFKRLGIVADELSDAVTESTRQAVSDLNLLTERIVASGASAETTGRVLEKAMVNAFRNVKNEADRTELIAVFQGWKKEGLITADAVKRIEESVSGIGQAAKDLEAKMKEAGIVSQSALNDVAASARSLYEEIKAAGKPLEDQRVAFINYAQAAIAANENVTAAQRETTLAQLELQAAVLGVSEQYEQLAGTAVAANGKVAESSRETVAATEEVAETAQRAGVVISETGQALAVGFAGARAEMAAIGPAAESMFLSLMGIQSATADTDDLTASLNAAQQAMASATNAMILGDSFSRYAAHVEQAKAATLLAYQEQKIKALDYISALESGKGVNQAFINQAMNAQQWMQLLGEEDLSQLQSAIDSANQKLLAMTDSAKSTLNSLQDELDRLQGNQAAIDQREYENKKAELSAALEEARRYGNQEAIKFYSEALRTLDQVRSEKQKQQRADAQQNNTRPAGVTSETRRVIELQLPSGKAADITVASEQDGQRLLDTLEEFAKRSR